LYAALIETRILQGAACLRALTLDEADDYRSIGLSNPIVVVPSGIDAPEEASGEEFYALHPELRGKRIVLFLGRLHEKKGLPMLLRAWSRAARPDEAHLVIAGPDSDDMLSQLERTRSELKLESTVTFAGMLSGSRKWSALAAASLFVLPSYSEGFSIAVIEAMAMALPVLLTHQCHIPEVAKRKCGWAIDPEINPLEEALGEFFQLSSCEASRMGERGRELVSQRYQWSVVGKQMAEVYNWLEGGPKPNQVTIV
jgi:glycosyltransferase involved in cell wall biosynthesis